MNATIGPKRTASAAEMKTSGPVLISYRGLGKEFFVKGAPLMAVRNIDLEVGVGQIVTLVGPSGCGKSTLLNMTAGLYQPTAGEVLYKNSPVMSLNHRVGYMTQSDHLLPWRTIAGNIAAPLEIGRVSRAETDRRVVALLDLVGLRNFSESYPSQISGGMRKRCALARLLAYDPEALLMDEPFGALDAQLRLRLQVELRQLCKDLGKTVLFVTHDLEEAVAIGDRCAVFSASPGTILETFEIPLPAQRDLMKLRFDETFRRTCARLWECLSPAIAQQSEETR